MEYQEGAHPSVQRLTTNEFASYITRREAEKKDSHAVPDDIADTIIEAFASFVPTSDESISSET